MVKKILLISSLLIIASCQSKTQKISPNNQSADKASVSKEYQIIENEEQAQEINQMAAKKIAQKVEEIEVQDQVLFSYDSAIITDSAKEILKNQAGWLNSDYSISVTIEGHCDERGTREYNIALGERRANAVKKFLIGSGVEASRIKVISYGKEKPAFFGSSESVMAKNRRAVTVVK